MVEPITLITTLGITSGAKLVLEELKKDTTQAWVKDVPQDCLKDAFKKQANQGTGLIWDKAVKFITREPLEEAAETAISVFLVLINEHLAQDLKLGEEQGSRFQKPLPNFFKSID